MILTEGEKLLADLEGLVEEEVYYQIQDFLQQQEEKIGELEDEVKEKEGEIRELEEALHEAPLPEDAMEEGFIYLKFPSWMGPANSNRVGELEELIQKIGVEESVEAVSQLYSLPG